eukprot:8126974-Pyramimonas_sp.AAC.1
MILPAPSMCTWRTPDNLCVMSERASKSIVAGLRIWSERCKRLGPTGYGQLGAHWASGAEDGNDRSGE